LGLTDIVAVSGGYDHYLALKSDGTVWSWGYNSSGELGDNTTQIRYSPVQVRGPGGTGYLTGVTAIAAGWYHSLALKNDGTVWGWGDNSSYQLGDNTWSDRYTPIQVLGPGGTGTLSGITAIAADYDHSLAYKSDGTIWAWGTNSSGQIGDGTSTDRKTPVQVNIPVIP
jgi:alpha-tubulin suppressor-like RCC1 family protein